MVQLTENEKARADARADFLKRFFAVAVSVGFASKVIEFEFLIKAAVPSRTEAETFFMLVLAMIIIIGSWDFYFASINKKPLKDWKRFALDVVIVSVYIILLVSVKNIDVFFFYVSLVLFLYFVWDLLSIRAYPDKYNLSNARWWTISKFCLSGVFSKAGLRGSIPALGPFITVWWLVVFAAIDHQVRKGSFEFSWLWLCAFIGYVLYRRDQSVHWGIIKRTASTALVFAILYLPPRFAPKALDFFSWFH